MTPRTPVWTPDGPDGAGRRLPLAGADNFRDIGGYRAADGRQIRHGLVFRADALHRLTDADHALLAPLALKVVCDFRSKSESCAAPYTWRSPAPELFPQPIESGVDEAEAVAEIRRHPTVESSRKAMLAIYRNMPATNAPQYRALLRRILAGHLPLVCHCSAGKDRTGLFIALLLTTLGTPYKTVMQDYLLSNEYLLESETTRHLIALMRGFLRLDGAVETIVQPFLCVEPLYLDTAYKTIDKNYGSFDAYRERALGLTTQDVTELRRRLLE